MRGNGLAFLRNFGIKYLNEIILTVVWVLAIVIINPIGEFPLNDDWAYSKNVYHLSQEGQLLLSDWPAMTLIAQVVWGALVTWIFGFSFTALRLSTLFIGLVAILYFYRILINTTYNRSTSFVGALLLMFTPLYFLSSYTFMTEVYFLFTLILSLFYFFNFYKTEKIRDLLIGSTLVLLSALIRQPGVAMGVAFAVIFLLKKRFSIKNLIIAITPTIIALTGLYLYLLWIKVTGRVTKIYEVGILVKNLNEAPFEYYWGRFGLLSMYFGLFSLPVSILLIPRLFKKSSWYVYGIVILLGGMTFISGYLTDFPAGNVIFNLGLGPKLLKDSYWNDNLYPLLSAQTLYYIKLISILSAVIIVTWFSIETIKGIKKFFKDNAQPARLTRATGIAFFLIYFASVWANPGFFDRYLLPCLPFLFLIILPIKPLFVRSNRVIFGILFSIYIIFCIAATHDYLSWNRSRWLAIDYLTKDMKIKKEKIDGGFEFNAWFQTGPWNPVIKGRISWWCVAADDYVVSFGNIERFKTIKRIPYLRFLPPGHDSLSILRKESIKIPDSAYPVICDCEKKSSDNNFLLSKNADFEFNGGNLQSKSESRSGEYSIQLDSINIYGLFIMYGEIQTNDHYTLRVWRKGLDEKAGLVVAATPGNNLYSLNAKAIEKTSNGWELIQSEIVIPENCNGLNLAIYLWNSGKNTVWFDDLEIIKHPNKEVDL